MDGEAFRRMMRRAIEKFLSRPNYYRICGKPVFMIYEVGSFVKGMGGMEQAAAALRQFDADCAKAGTGRRRGLRSLIPKSGSPRFDFRVTDFGPACFSR